MINSYNFSNPNDENKDMNYYKINYFQFEYFKSIQKFINLMFESSIILKTCKNLDFYYIFKEKEKLHSKEKNSQENLKQNEEYNNKLQQYKKEQELRKKRFFAFAKFLKLPTASFKLEDNLNSNIDNSIEKIISNNNNEEDIKTNFSFFNYVFLNVNFSLLINSRKIYDFANLKNKDNLSEISAYNFLIDKIYSITRICDSTMSKDNIISYYKQFDYNDFNIKNNFIHILHFSIENCDKIIKPFNITNMYFMYKTIKLANFILQQNMFSEEKIFKALDLRVFNLPQKIIFLVFIVVTRYEKDLNYQDKKVYESALTTYEQEKSDPSIIIKKFINLYFNFSKVLKKKNVEDLIKINEEFKVIVGILPELKLYSYDLIYAFILELFLFLSYLVKNLNYNDVNIQQFEKMDNEMKEILIKCNFIIPKEEDDSNLEDDEEKEKVPVTFFYYIDPRCSVVTDYENKKFLDTVDRSSPLSKLKGLIDQVEIYKIKVEYLEGKPQKISESDENQLINKKDLLIGKTSIISFITNYSNADFINFIIVCIINLTLIFFDGYFWKKLVFYLGLTLVLLNGFFIIIYLYYTYKFNIELSKKENKQKIELNDVEDLTSKEPDSNSFYYKTISFLLKFFYYIYEALYTVFYYFYDYIWNSFLFNVDIYYVILCFSISLSGLIKTEHIALLYSILLIGIIKFNLTSKEILLAFFIRRDQIIAMLAFLVIFIHIFSSVAYYHMNVEYTITSEHTENKPINACSSLLACEALFFNYGVRIGGGIGSVLNGKAPSSGKYYWLRLLTDNVFFIVISLLIVQMFSGIIIETFGTLRDDNESQNDDKETRCFICSIRNIEFKKRNIDFNNHKIIEHNVNDFIKVILSYKLMEEEEAKHLDFHQKYIRDCINKMKYECFPIGMISKKNVCIKVEEE